MQSHDSIELLAERLYSYFSEKIPNPQSAKKYGRDWYLQIVGYFMQEHRDKKQVIQLVDSFLRRAKYDSTVVIPLMIRFCKPLCQSHSDVIGEFGIAPVWSRMDLTLLISQYQLIWRYGTLCPKLLKEPAVVVALLEISKLIVTRLSYPFLVPQIVAMLDSRHYSVRRIGSIAVKVICLIDYTGCEVHLKKQHLSPEVQRSLDGIFFKRPELPR